MNIAIREEFRHSNFIQIEITRPLGAPWIVVGLIRGRRWRMERRQKWECHFGLLSRLRKDTHKPPVPSMFLRNTSSLTHKMDKLELLTVEKSLCMWLLYLHPLIPDTAVQLAGCTGQCWDSNKDSGKSRGGELWILFIITGPMLSPIPYTLDCRPTHISNTIVKFAEDTTVVGLISGGDKRSSSCLFVNNLALNTTKTREFILD